MSQAPSPDPESVARAARIRLVLFDADGVLTDGAILVGAGGLDVRAFYVRDGLGILLGREAGLAFGIVSGRRSPAVAERAADLGIVEVHQGVPDKVACVLAIAARHDLALDAVCFVGDDLVDAPIMRRVGLGVAPQDATPEARAAAHYVTTASGGRGAAREEIDLVLHASGRWPAATRRFME